MPAQAGDYSMPYYIGVDLTNQIVTVYRTSDNTIARQMLCSSGMNDSTPEGIHYMEEGWRVNERKPWLWLGEYQCWVRYATRIWQGYMFHSLPFSRRDASAMIEQSARELGTPTSHGCMRLRVDDARFISENCGVGTMVRLYKEPEKQEELRELLLVSSYTGEGGMTYDEFQGYSEDELGRGSGGTQVMDLQCRLQGLGYYGGDASGRYDTDTVAAVKHVQADLGMAQTGITSNDLAQLLYSADAPVSTGQIDLFEGRSGPVVGRLQEGLARLGLYEGELDSVYDVDVANAVRLFQGLCNYRVDGIATAEQQQALYYILRKLDDHFGEGNVPAPQRETETLKMATLDVDVAVIVRAQPTTKSSELGKLHKGDIMIVDGAQGEWAQVSNGVGTGYVKKDFLQPFTQENVMLTFEGDAGETLRLGHTRKEYKAGAQSLADEFSAYYTSAQYTSDLPQSVRIATVNTGSDSVALNLRERAGTDGEVLASVPNGTRLRVLAEEAGWVQVGYADRIGYLMSDYLEFAQGSLDELEAVEPTLEDEQAEDAQDSDANEVIQAVVICRGKNSAPVYDAGSKDAKRLGKLQEGTRLEVISVGVDDDWVKIRYRGHTGYMLDDDLQFQLM